MDKHGKERDADAKEVLSAHDISLRVQRAMQGAILRPVDSEFYYYVFFFTAYVTTTFADFKLTEEQQRDFAIWLCDLAEADPRPQWCVLR